MEPWICKKKDIADQLCVKRWRGGGAVIVK